MKLVKLKQVIQTLENLKEGYEDLKDKIADEVRDDEIEKATAHFAELTSIKKSIEQMENLDVQV